MSFLPRPPFFDGSVPSKLKPWLAHWRRPCRAPMRDLMLYTHTGPVKFPAWLIPDVCFWGPSAAASIKTYRHAENRPGAVCVYITRPRILQQAHRHAVAKLLAEYGRLLELLDQRCLLRIRSSAPIGRTTNLYSSSAARTLHLSRRMPAEQSHTGLTLKTNYQAHEPI